MYKFNYLNKINIEKQKAKEVNHLMNFVFYSALALSITFILIMVFKSMLVGNSYQDIKKSMDEIVSGSEKLHTSKAYFTNNKIGSVYNYQMNRIVWTELFNTLENNMDSISSLEELNFNGSQLDCKVMVKVSEANNNRAEIQTLMTKYQERLFADSVFKSYLKEHSEKDISIPEQPNLEPGNRSTNWTYRMEFNMRSIVQPTAATSGESNRKRF